MSLSSKFTILTVTEAYTINKVTRNVHLKAILLNRSDFLLYLTQ